MRRPNPEAEEEWGPAAAISRHRNDPPRRCQQKKERFIRFLPKHQHNPYVHTWKRNSLMQRGTALTLSRCFTFLKWGVRSIKKPLYLPFEVGVARLSPSYSSGCPSRWGWSQDFMSGERECRKMDGKPPKRKRIAWAGTPSARGGRWVWNNAPGDLRSSWDLKNLERSSRQTGFTCVVFALLRFSKRFSAKKKAFPQARSNEKH